MSLLSEIADLYVVLRGVNDEFVGSMEEAGAASEATDGKIAATTATIGKLALGTTAAAIAIGVEAVKLDTQFQTLMERISTLASVPQSSIAGLSSGVLSLAGKVGTDPDSLAAALYHVESSFQSTGISSAKAMQILKIGAEGAKIGGADLTDVMNALDAAVVSGIPGVQNISAAMGGLLKIVGSGDMTMQDFADAAGTGILAVGKVYGATLNDVGAALATFGDNNIRGQKAATDLRMSIMDLTKQAAPGQAALAGIGIKANQLRTDMESGGLNKAMTDLYNHLLAAGDGGVKMGAVLEDAFTKKSSAPLAILLSQFDRFQSKYAEMSNGADSFAQAWAKTQATFQQQLDQIADGAKALGVRLGEAIIPVLERIIAVIGKVIGWFERHKRVVQELASLLKDVLAGAAIIAGGIFLAMAADLLTTIAPFLLVAGAIGAVIRWLDHLYNTSAKFRAWVNGIVQDVKIFVNDFKAGFNDPGVDNGITGWMGAAYKLGETLRRVFGEIKTAWADFTQGFSGKEGKPDGLKGWEQGFYEFGGIVHHTLDAVMKAVETVFTFFQHHTTMLKAVLLGLAFAMAPWVTGVAVAVFLIIKYWKDLKGAYEDVRRVVLTVVDAITGYLDRHHKEVQKIVGTLKAIWGDLEAIVMDLVPIFKVVFEVVADIVMVAVDIIVDLWKRFGKHLLQHLETAFNSIMQILRGAFEVIRGIFDIFAGIFTGKWSKVWKGVKEIFGGLWNIILGVFKFVINAISTVLGAAVAVISAVWDACWTGVKDAFVTVWNWIEGFFKGLLARIASYLVDAGTWLLKYGKDIIVGLWHGITTAWTTVFNFFGGLKATLAGYLVDAGTWLYDIGKDIVKGLAKGITDAGKHIGDDIKNLGGDVTGAAKKIFEIGSPSKLSAREIGLPWVQGVAKGIIDNSTLAKKAMGALLPSQLNINASGRVSGIGGGTAGPLPSLGSTPAGSTGTGNVYLTVQGTIIDTQGLFDAVQKAGLTFQKRNAKTGLVLTRKR